jgi:hypothetical protein
VKIVRFPPPRGFSGFVSTPWILSSWNFQTRKNAILSKSIRVSRVIVSKRIALKQSGSGSNATASGKAFWSISCLGDVNCLLGEHPNDPSDAVVAVFSAVAGF